jgi:hypothetical protein
VTPPRKREDSDPPNAPSFDEENTTRIAKIEQEMLRTRDRLHRLSNLSVAHQERLDELGDLDLVKTLTDLRVAIEGLRARFYTVTAMLGFLIPTATAVILRLWR